MTEQEKTLVQIERDIFWGRWALALMAAALLGFCWVWYDQTSVTSENRTNLKHVAEEQRKLGAGQEELRKGQVELSAEQKELRDGQAELMAEQKELKAGQEELRSEQKELKAGLAELRAGQEDLRQVLLTLIRQLSGEEGQDLRPDPVLYEQTER